MTQERSGSATAFLVVSVLAWLPYGIYCFFVPTGLQAYAHLLAESATARTELRAMYGGLEAAIGAFALLALLRPPLTHAFVLLTAFLAGGLLLARVGGVVVDGGLSGYTAGALVFELVLTGWAVSLLRAETR